MFTSKKLFQQKSIRHGFFNKKGGKSIGIYKSLNCGIGSNDKKNKVFFKMEKNIIYFDLPGFVKSQLKSNKITNIDTINIDTFDKKNNFFSARRSLRLKHEDYGRNISLIMIN